MKRLLAFILGIACLLSGCSRSFTDTVRAEALTAVVTVEGQKGSFECFALDTLIRVQLWGEDPVSAAQKMLREVERLEGLFSVGDPKSDIARLNAAGGEWVDIAPETGELLSVALALHKETDGAFDPALYRVKCAWGWPDAPHVPETSALQTALAASGAQHLELQAGRARLLHGAQADLGGIAKGYIADRLCLLAQEEEVTAALIDLGGNIQTVGTKPDGKPWAVGVRDPEDPARYAGILRFTGTRAVVTSGMYERSFEEDGIAYGHILDPETGFPVEGDLASVTIVAQEGTLGDALSTACFVLGEEKSFDLWRNRQDFSLIAVKNTGEILASGELEGEFSPQDGCSFIQP